MNRPYILDDQAKLSMRSERIEGRPAHLNRATSLVKSAARSGSFEAGWAAYEAVSEPDVVLQCAALHLCARALWFQRAAHVWDSTSPDHVAYCSMIDVCARCRKVDFAKRLFREMDDAGVEKTLIAYNSMIHACGMCGQAEEALGYFESIPSALLDQAGVANQQTTFQLVMMASAREGDYGKARDLFGQMVARQIPPNNTHFNALMAACAHGCLASLAQQVFDLMPRYGVEPDAANWTILLSCHREDLPGCLRIMRRMEAAGVRATGLTYQALLKAHVLARDGPGARALIREKEGHWTPGRRFDELVRDAEGLP